MWFSIHLDWQRALVQAGNKKVQTLSELCKFTYVQAKPEKQKN